MNKQQKINNKSEYRSSFFPQCCWCLLYPSILESQRCEWTWKKHFCGFTFQQRAFAQTPPPPTELHFPRDPYSSSKVVRPLLPASLLTPENPPAQRCVALWICPELEDGQRRMGGLLKWWQRGKSNEPPYNQCPAATLLTIHPPFLLQ